jgi:hypothetical protein
MRRDARDARCRLPPTAAGAERMQQNVGWPGVSDGADAHMDGIACNC